MSSSEKTKRGRGRPRGSKNKKQKVRNSIDSDFSNAFGHVEVASEDLKESEVEDEASVNFASANDDDVPALYEGSTLHVGHHINELIQDANDLEGNEVEETNRDVLEKDDDDGISSECVGFGEKNAFSTQDLVDLCNATATAKTKTEDQLKSLKDACVAENSRKCYTGAICGLILNYFNNDKTKLHKSWIQALETRTFGLDNDKEKAKVLRKTVLRLLSTADKKAPPLDFEQYSAKEFMIYLLSLRKNNKRMLSNATYANARSALFHLYRLYDRKQSENFVNELSMLLRGLRRKITKKKQAGEGNIQSGKAPLSYDMYRQLNEWMLEEGTMESIFGRAFLCLTWNLMCRSANTISIHMHHMEWHNDSLAIFFAHMKNDQIGERKRDPRHIYANPIDPIVCPILALGIYFIVFPLAGSKDTSLFPGTNQYIRFTKYFHSVLERHEEKWIDLFGCEITGIGVHSIRKGAATYVSSGSTCAPPQVATNIRAGWTMGAIQDTYLRYESAGDQYVGRVASGLPLSSAQFAVLPPEITGIDQQQQKRMLQEMFPNLPTTLNQVAKFLGSSCLYHLPHLKRILKPAHPFLCSTFCCSETCSEMKNKVPLRYAYEGDDGNRNAENCVNEDTRDDNEEDNDPVSEQISGSDLSTTVYLNMTNSDIRAGTGIPSHVLIIAKMEQVIAAQSMMLEKIRTVLSSELDKRELGQSNHLFKQDIKNMLDTFTTKISDEVSKLPHGTNIPSTLTQEFYKTIATTNGNLFFWKNKYRRVPETFDFPMKMSLSSAWH